MVYPSVMTANQDQLMRMCSCDHCNYFARLDRPSIPKMILASLKVHNRVSFIRLYAFIFANYPFGSMDSEAIVRNHLRAMIKAKKVGVLMIKNKLRYVI